MEALIDHVGSIVFGSAMMLLFIIGNGAPNSAQSADAVEQIEDSLSYQRASLVFGLAFVALGGWIAGRLGREAPFKNAAAGGGICVFTSLLMIGAGFGRSPAWHVLASLVLAVPAALLGAVMVNRRRQ